MKAYYAVNIKNAREVGGNKSRFLILQEPLAAWTELFDSNVVGLGKNMMQETDHNELSRSSL